MENDALDLNNDIHVDISISSEIDDYSDELDKAEESFARLEHLFSVMEKASSE